MELKKTKAELEQLQEQHTATKGSMAALRVANEAAESDLLQYKTQLQHAGAQNSANDEEINKLQQQMNNLKRKHEQELQTQKEQISELQFQLSQAAKVSEEHIQVMQERASLAATMAQAAERRKATTEARDSTAKAQENITALETANQKLRVELEQCKKDLARAQEAASDHKMPTIMSEIRKYHQEVIQYSQTSQTMQHQMSHNIWGLLQLAQTASAGSSYVPQHFGMGFPPSSPFMNYSQQPFPFPTTQPTPTQQTRSQRTPVSPSSAQRDENEPHI